MVSACIWFLFDFLGCGRFFRMSRFLNFNACLEIQTFDRKGQLPPNFCGRPVFLNCDVLPEIPRSTGNSSFRPEIRTFDPTFERSTRISNVRPDFRTFDPNFERATGISKSQMAPKVDSGTFAVFKKGFISKNRCRGS